MVTRPIITAASILALLLMTPMASAMERSLGGTHSHGCQKCGCKKEVKKKMCLVKVTKVVEIPCYDCQKDETFYPHKGLVCHTGYRSDTFCTLHKNCCDGQLKCCCKTECGCKTLYGAKATGCFKPTCIKAPVKTVRKEIVTYKWIAVPVCETCCSSSKNHK